MTLEPVAKRGNKYSALERSINRIYKLPLPREPIHFGTLPSSLPSTNATPVCRDPNKASRTPVEGQQDQFRRLLACSSLRRSRRLNS